MHGLFNEFGVELPGFVLDEEADAGVYLTEEPFIVEAGQNLIALTPVVLELTLALNDFGRNLVENPVHFLDEHKLFLGNIFQKRLLLNFFRCAVE